MPLTVDEYLFSLCQRLSVFMPNPMVWDISSHFYPVQDVIFDEGRYHLRDSGFFHLIYSDGLFIGIVACIHDEWRHFLYHEGVIASVLWCDMTKPLVMIQADDTLYLWQKNHNENCFIDLMTSHFIAPGILPTLFQEDL